jgi:hypothetical protein
MSDPYKITLDKRHIDVIDLEHYLDEGELTIIYDIGIDHKEWGIKDISVVIRHIYGDLSLEVEDEASDLLLEDPIFKEITIDTKLKGGKFPLWNIDVDWITHDNDQRSICPSHCEIHLKQNKIEVWI